MLRDLFEYAIEHDLIREMQEDLRTTTGFDIIAKLEETLVNELKEINKKVKVINDNGLI